MIEAFLPEPMLERLRAWVLDNEAAFSTSTVNYEPTSRAPADWRPAVGVWEWPLKDEFESRMAALAPDLIRDFRISPAQFSWTALELVARNTGSSLQRHIDTTLGADHLTSGPRLVSAVYYFHREPRAFAGGALRLYRFGAGEAAEDYIEIEPRQNSLIAFPSWASHAVTPIDCPSGDFADSRFAVAMWIYGPPPAASMDGGRFS
jgi:SM-20-related protein